MNAKINKDLIIICSDRRKPREEFSASDKNFPVAISAVFPKARSPKRVGEPYR